MAGRIHAPEFGIFDFIGKVPPFFRQGTAADRMICLPE
jgi:hypothetical protein